MMRGSNPVLLIFLAVFLILCVPPHPADSSPSTTQPSIAADVVSGGGAEGEFGGEYRFHDTVAQGPVGEMAVGDDIQLLDGFWPVAVTATPSDFDPPGLSISVFQNPFVTNHLDILVVADETMMDSSMYCQVGDEVVDLEKIDHETEHLYRGDYDLYTTGAMSVLAAGRDIALNWDSTSYDFSSTLILVASGGVARSVDGRCEVSVPGGAVTGDTYVLVFAVSEDTGLEAAYEVSPAGLRLGDYVEISIAYDGAASRPEHLCIARMGSGEAIPVECYVDAEQGRVVAYVDRLGSYGLLWRPDEVTPTYDRELVVLQNIPNPFAASTSIGFELGIAGRVRVEVITVGGRHVKDLLDGSLIPGEHRVRWDGTDISGEPVASGVYLYRVECDSGTKTRKMVYLR